MYDSMGMDGQLGLLGTGVEKEVIMLRSLMLAREAITDFNFKDTCINLYIGKKEFEEWQKMTQAQDYAEVGLIRVVLSDRIHHIFV